MPVYKYTKEITNKKNGKKVKKNAYRCIGSYVDPFGMPQKYHKRGFETEKEAKEWERMFLINAQTVSESSITFEELFKLFLDYKKPIIKQRSFDDLKYTVTKHILPFWGKYKLDKITLALVMKWQNEILEWKFYSHKEKKEVYYSNAFLENIQMYLKMILKYGAKTGKVNNIQILSFENVKHRDQQKKEMLFWQPEEYEKFIQEVTDPSFIALFNILYWCGLRLGETLALNWNDIDLKTKTIKITKTWNDHHRIMSTPKTQNSYRNVIMPDKCFEAVYALYELQKGMDEFNNDVFLFGYEKPFDDNTVRSKKRKACAKAGVKDIRLHDFRHSHVSLLISLGFSPFDIAKRLGHTVEMVNEVYGHWFTNAQQIMVDKLNSI